MKKTKEELETARRKLQTLDRWYGILLISGSTIILFGLFVLDNLTVSLIGVIPALIAVIFLVPQFRCPYCGGYLSTKFGLPDHCPHCGEPLTGQISENNK